MVDGRRLEAANTPTHAAASANPVETGSGRNARRQHQNPDGSTSTARPALSERESEAMRCERGIWYHDDRERFFDRLHRFLMFAVIATGAGAGADLVKAVGWFDSKYLAIAGGLIGAADIAWNISGKARLHAMLKRDAVNILERIVGGADLQEVRAAIARSHADEPPMMHAINFMAYNAVQRAHDRPESTCVEIGFIQKWLRHWRAFSAEDFKDKPVTKKGRRGAAEDRRGADDPLAS
jgi:hypothetical protein